MRTNTPLLFLATILAVMLAGAAAVPAQADSFVVDASHSAVLFRANHLGAGYTYGRFNDVSGRFEFDADSGAGGAVEIVIKAGSVDSNDGKRDEHLRGPDFFDAKLYPLIRFESTKVEKTGEGRYEISGKLHFHGHTRAVTVSATHIGNADHPKFGFKSGFETRFTIKRSDFGVDYLLDGVADDVMLIVSIEGKRE